MTPQAVVHRYLQIANDSGSDPRALAEVISCDPYLSGRWLNLFGCAANPARLLSNLQALEPSVRIQTAQSIAGVAEDPLSLLVNWRAALERHWLAQLIAEEMFVEQTPGQQPSAASESNTQTSLQTQSMAWRVHLAHSGTEVNADSDLGDLIAYRGMQPRLLEDASLDQKILAVIDAADNNENEAIDTARQLLGIESPALISLLQEAKQACKTQLEELAIGATFDQAKNNELSAMQQLGLLSALFTHESNKTADLSSSSGVSAAHQLACKSLFEQPLALLQLDAGQQHLHWAEQPSIHIPLNSNSSLIASSVRDSKTQHIEDSVDFAVADRRLLRQMQFNKGLCVPVSWLGHSFAVLVAPDITDALFMFKLQQYAKALGHWLHADKQSDDLSELDKYRELEKQRLSELVHEVNNPLSIVRNYLHILEPQLQQTPEVTEQVNLIRQELQRAIDLVQTARQLSSLEPNPEVEKPLTLHMLDANDLVTSCYEIHRGYAADANVEVELDLHSGPMMVQTDEQRGAQIFSNLLKNAIESGGTKITLSSRSGVFRAGSEGVEISVDDNGPGLPRDVLDQLALPKQSSKGGAHQGLGLRIVHQLVAELGGQLDVRTQPGRGTEFTVFLPG